MDIFDLRRQVVEDYATFAWSFMRLKADVMGPSHPSKTSGVLKDKEMRLYGEYRTRRLVFDAWRRTEAVIPAPTSLPEPIPC